jgi:hypothetical protein
MVFDARTPADRRSRLGFNTVSDIGKRVEDAAATGDRPAIDTCISEYADYLSKVKVVYE